MKSLFIAASAMVLVDFLVVHSLGMLGLIIIVAVTIGVWLAEVAS